MMFSVDQFPVACAEPRERIVDVLHGEHDAHGPSSNGFASIEPGRRIDFIFLRGTNDVLQHVILSDTFNDPRFPSDHLPVMAELRAGKARGRIHRCGAFR